MPYAIFDIDISQPLPCISLSDSDSGIAVLVRRAHRPVGFWLEALPTGSTLMAKDLAKRVHEHVAVSASDEPSEPHAEAPQELPAPPSITVAVCTRDRPQYLARCLHSLREQAPGPFRALPAFEILVVDNAPSDETSKSLVESLPGVRYVREPKPGLNFARNRALREATTELLAFVDDDVAVDRHWLAGLVEAWLDHPDAAAFTGQILPYELATDAQIMFEQRGGFRRGFVRVRYGARLAGDCLYPGRAGIFGSGANMAFRRDVLLALGGFDDALDTGAALPGGGDLDIFYRVIRANYTLVYEPGYLAFHEHRRDAQALSQQYKKSWGSGFMAFVAKSYRHDAANRPALRRLTVWWFLHECWQLQKSLRGRHALPPAMLLAELWGGVVGLMGGYARSLKLTEEIRRQYA